jgi:hypothetical protein
MSSSVQTAIEIRPFHVDVPSGLSPYTDERRRNG